MNFLLRPAQTAAVAAAEQPSVSSGNSNTLEGLISEDPHSSSGDEHSEDFNRNGSDNGSATPGSKAKPDAPIVENYIEVAEEEGWITIPYKEIPDDWSEASDIVALRSLDRSFVFPGEQVHILACLSAYKQDTEIITPFKVAAMMTKNGIGRQNKKQNGDMGSEADSVSESLEVSPGSQDDENPLKEVIDQKKDISAGESLLRMEDHRRQTQSLLRRFENSHFFVRISESDEPLWSKRSSAEYSETAAVTFDSAEARKTTKSRDSLNAIIDRGKFDASVSGGLARNSVKCCSLPNGDIVVLLQVNIGIDYVKNPVLEIFQFEKHGSRNLTDETTSNAVSANQDPCGELLKWLLPLDNSVSPPSRPLSPPKLSSSSSIRSTSTKVNFSASSGSQLFSFGHLRSYSMSSLPPNITPPQPVTPTSKPNVDLEDWDKLASQKLVKSSKVGSERLLSFRGVSLEPDRFSVRCGLEGIYIPGRRWRRKIEIIQPIEIHSFAADCNTDDLLCVQIKNVSPAHTPDIVVYLDAITIVYEEVSNGGVPSSLPIACIESGAGHTLPNLALRRGEEHSFILKPATSIWKATRGSQSPHLLAGSSQGLTPRFVQVKRNASAADQFAVLVSCRCNYTESKLFFKQPTSWRPRISRDLMISVASEVSRQNVSLNDGVAQLPVQVLTLQASNLTSEDLTLTVLAPASFTSPPSVVSLNSSPSSPTGRFAGHFESEGSLSGRSKKTAVHKLSSPTFPSENQRHIRSEGQRSASMNEKAISGVIPSTDLGCTHLWLQSRVPLGCVPSQSTANIKLELLPLTDGIITLDSLQIDVKEKGMTYIPEHSLKINATSSIATGVI